MAGASNKSNKISSFCGEYEFLSNFYVSPFIYNGLEYRTSEHAFHAAKCISDNDRERIRLVKTARGAKRLGRRIKMNVTEWNDKRDDIMLDILRAKFQQMDLKQRLLATGNSELIEENEWHDMYWGRCTCKKHTVDGEPVGENKLGQLLMQVREEFI